MKLSVVVPIFNEEGSLPEFARRVIPALRRATGSPEGAAGDFEIVFVMDPGTDRTEPVALELRARHPEIKLLKLSRRFGQPMATWAGLTRASGDAVVVMDVDLQDPPEVIPEMVARLQEGFDVVYGRRRSREGENPLKRLVAWVGYRLIRALAGVAIPVDAGDFRLMSRRAVDELLRFGDRHGFLRGLVALVGFAQTEVVFDRPARFSGRGKYNSLLGSLEIGFNGLFCFSNRVLRLPAILGGALVLGAVAALAVAPQAVSNRAILVALLAVSGLQLFGQGLLGAYLGRIYDEVRDRPRFIVDRAWGFD